MISMPSYRLSSPEGSIHANRSSSDPSMPSIDPPAPGEAWLPIASLCRQGWDSRWHEPKPAVSVCAVYRSYILALRVEWLLGSKDLGLMTSWGQLGGMSVAL